MSERARGCTGWILACTLWSAAALLVVTPGAGAADGQLPYAIVDTGQDVCYDDEQQVTCPAVGGAFYGQDAQVLGLQPAYRDNGDGTVTDLNTGLMWQQTPDLDDKSTFAEAVAEASGLSLAGYGDWRLPTVKELYSLIDFRGSSRNLDAYIDVAYFDFRFGDESRGERSIDAQYWTSTEYVGTTMNGDATTFGVNFADGRIKGYPSEAVGRPSNVATRFVRYVRGNTEYGVNDFVDNEDGTVTDRATGLSWQQADDGTTRNWEQSLAYCEGLVLGGSSDWRLPNAKELQSIVDYDRAPDATQRSQRGPAIDPVFEISEEESYFWSSTTLRESPPMLGEGAHAVYVAFGQAFGTMNGRTMNVHGAGAQRSDPKSGDPGDWAGGFGPQGDDIRIYNHARCVRDDSTRPVNLDRPSRLRASARSSSRVRLTWRDRSTGETGFEVQFRSALTRWRQVATANADATRATVSGLAANTTYRFRLRAIGGGSASDWSATRVTTPSGE